MPKVEVYKTIAAEKEAVWSFLTEIENWQRWWNGHTLISVEPRWEVGAEIVWDGGRPSRIYEYKVGEVLAWEDVNMDIRILRYISLKQDSYLFRSKKERSATSVTHGVVVHGASFGSGAEAQERRDMERSLESLRKLLDRDELGSSEKSMQRSGQFINHLFFFVICGGIGVWFSRYEESSFAHDPYQSQFVFGMNLVGWFLIAISIGALVRGIWKLRSHSSSSQGGSAPQEDCPTEKSQRNLFRTRQSETTPSSSEPPQPVATSSSSQLATSIQQAAPVRGRTKSSTLRLADPAYPARKQLEQVIKVVDQYVQVEVVGDRTAMKVSAPVDEIAKALLNLDEAIALYPNDLDLLVTKASILHAAAEFKSAEEVLGVVLDKDPHHFEAKMWKNHWATWSDALRFPKWHEQLSSLHPVMAFHLRLDHRVQTVRDDMQKALAIVSGVQGPPFDSRTQIKVEWVLSQTPYGPLVAYYLKIIEPSGEPSTLEGFLPIFQPTAFSPLEGFFLIQQLAFTPYCFVVLVNGNTMLLNRRIVFGQTTIAKIREIALQLSSTQSYLPQQLFQNAMQWHMKNFDMRRLTFE